MDVSIPKRGVMRLVAEGVDIEGAGAFAELVRISERTVSRYLEGAGHSGRGTQPSGIRSHRINRRTLRA